jgi:heme oxygenase
MLARLHDETRAHHADADAARLTPLASPASVVAYATYLARIHGFEAPVEDALSRTRDLALVADVLAWSRAQAIRDDLVMLGMDPAQAATLPRFPRIPAFPSPAHALGWIYVIERNAPLHGIVRRHLARRMPGQADVASTYLATAEALASQHRRALVAALDAIAAPAGNEVVEAAHLAFRAQHRWLRQSVSPERTADRAP